MAKKTRKKATPATEDQATELAGKVTDDASQAAVDALKASKEPQGEPQGQYDRLPEPASLVDMDGDGDIDIQDVKLAILAGLEVEVDRQLLELTGQKPTPVVAEPRPRPPVRQRGNLLVRFDGTDGLDAKGQPIRKYTVTLRGAR